MSVNLRFSFKMDLADISTIDFAFAETYADLETDPFLEKSYPEVGTLQNKAIVIPLSDEEAEELPTQFYALSTVNFINGSTVKAHAFKNTAKESALSAILMTDNTEYNIDFFIDETNGGGGGVDAYINGVKLEGYKTAAELDLVKASEDIKVWSPVWDGSNVSDDPADYPGIKNGDIMIYAYGPTQMRVWSQMMNPTDSTVYWSEATLNSLRSHYSTEDPPTTVPPGDSTYRVGDFYFQDIGNNITKTYILINKVGTPPTSCRWKEVGNNIFSAVFDENNKLDTVAANYLGIKKGDFIIDDNGGSLYTSPRIWRVMAFSPNNAFIYPQYITGNSINYPYNTLPTTFTSGTYVYIPNKGDIWQAKDSKYYLCADKVSDGGHPATYTITWQEVTFIPKPTTADAGKVLKVNVDGEPEWVSE